MRDGQSAMVGRCGGNFAPGIDPVFVKEYDDELSVMYFDLNHPPPRVATQLRRVRRILEILKGAREKEKSIAKYLGTGPLQETLEAI